MAYSFTNYHHILYLQLRLCKRQFRTAKAVAGVGFENTTKRKRKLRLFIETFLIRTFARLSSSKRILTRFGCAVLADILRHTARNTINL